MEVEETIEINQKLINFILPQGGLKNPFMKKSELLGQEHAFNQETNSFISPQGDMKNQFHPYDERFEHIEVTRIVNYYKVSFKSKSRKTHPVLLTNGVQYYCISNWNLVAFAIESGAATILCLVKKVETLSDLCLSINCAGLRIKPENDAVTYPEILKAFKTIWDEYEDTGVDTSHMEHGGARRGDAYLDMKEDDFIDNELVPELGKTRETIRNYKSDALYIADDLFQHLIDHKVGKKFFEKIRNKKSEAIRSLEEGLNNKFFNISESATNIISHNVQNAYIELKSDNPIPEFELLTSAEINHIGENVKLKMSQFEKEIEEEKEQKRLDILNGYEEETKEEVKFPSFEKAKGNQSADEEKEKLLAELKLLHEELGKLLSDTTITSDIDGAVIIKAKVLKLVTA